MQSKQWRIMFRVIFPEDFCIPLLYIPVAVTIIEAESADAAWEKLISDPYALPRDYYHCIDIEEYDLTNEGD